VADLHADPCLFYLPITIFVHFGLRNHPLFLLTITTTFYRLPVLIQLISLANQQIRIGFLQ